MQWYCTEFRDPFMLREPGAPWFLSFLVCELFFQLPFFFAAVRALWTGREHSIRIPGIIYGVHVATTVIPLLAEIAFGEFSGLYHDVFGYIFICVRTHDYTSLV